MHAPDPQPPGQDEEPDVKPPPVPPDQAPEVVPQGDPPRPGQNVPLVATGALRRAIRDQL
jgi:hypothetical protein